MKKVLLLLMCFISVQLHVLADDDKPIRVEQLPANTRQFITNHFPDIAVSYAKMEKELFSKSYEVILVNGSKLEFDKKGEWKEISCKTNAIPSEIIPQKISEYILKNHPNNQVVEMERDNRDYEVKLNNNIELKFDLQFNFKRYD